MSVAAGVMALIMCLFPVRETRADSVGVKPFIAFGADLTAKEKKEVVKQFGLTEFPFAASLSDAASAGILLPACIFLGTYAVVRTIDRISVKELVFE